MILELGKTMLTEWAETARTLLGSAHEVAVEENRIARELEQNGVVILRGFYDPIVVESLSDAVRTVIASSSPGVWTDPQGSDRRFYGAERYSALIASYLTDERILRIGRHYMRNDMAHRITLAAQMTYQPGNKGSGAGWHRDSPTSRQFKSLLYLSHVDGSNGPFEYVAGSHRRQAVLDLVGRGLQTFRQYRFGDEQVQKILAATGLSLVRFQGQAGDLALVDTKGIHRGAPMAMGERLALTNYYYRKAIPEHFAKVMN